MFSGIIEAIGTITRIEQDQDNIHFTLSCPFAEELSVDQSLAHDGVCLTVVKRMPGAYTVTAIRETLEKSNMRTYKVGDKVNLERSVKVDGRLDGHIVQGHVDQTAICTEVKEANGSWYFTFEYDASLGNVTVEKGSVSVNGVSLTVVNSKENSFQVAIIPYTYEVTNFHTFGVGTIVNIEFDILGKYIVRLLAQRLG